MTSTTKNKINTCLWFDDQAEEAVTFYISVFQDAEILGTTPYLVDTPSDKSIGSTMTVNFKLEEQQFTALNGGPFFTPNPSISFFVNCSTEKEVDQLWEKLSDGGTPLMPLDSYPFSDKYGWVQDQYGVSWQLILADGEVPQKIMPSLMFVGDNAGHAEDALNFYASIFDHSIIKQVARYGAGQEPDEEGTIMYADFELEGQRFAAMDSAHDHAFNFNEGISLVVNCETQNEIDYYWEELSADPKAEQCGWLKDRFGVSWQIVPTMLSDMFEGKATEKSERMMKAMLQMKKLSIEGLQKA